MTLINSAQKLKLLVDGAVTHGLEKFRFDNISIRPSHIDEIVEAIYEDLNQLDTNSGGGGASSFIDLTDTPSSFQADFFVINNSDGDGLEYIDPSTINLSTFINDVGFLTTSDGNGFKDGSGSIPTSTIATVTDSFSFVGGTFIGIGRSTPLALERFAVEGSSAFNGVVNVEGSNRIRLNRSGFTTLMADSDRVVIDSLTGFKVQGNATNSYINITSANGIGRTFDLFNNSNFSFKEAGTTDLTEFFKVGQNLGYFDIENDNLAIGREPSNINNKLEVYGKGLGDSTKVLALFNTLEEIFFVRDDKFVSVGAADQQNGEILGVDGRLYVDQGDYVFNSSTIGSSLANSRGNMIEFIEGGGINLNNYNNGLGANVGTQNYESYFINHKFFSPRNAALPTGRLYMSLNNNFTNSSSFTRMGVNTENLSNNTVLQVAMDRNGPIQVSNPTAYEVLDSYDTHQVDMGGQEYFKTGYKSILSNAFETTTTGNGIHRSLWLGATGADINQAIYSENGNVIIENGGVSVQGEGNTDQTNTIILTNQAGSRSFRVKDDSTFELGLNANSAGSGAVTIGRNATTLQAFGTAIGLGATSGSGIFCLAIGASAMNNGTASGQFAVGGRSSTTGASSFALGPQATADGEGTMAIGQASNASFSDSIALGQTAITTDSNQFVVGSINQRIDDIYIGRGVFTTSANIREVNYHPTSVGEGEIDGTAEDGTLIFNGARGTGTGAGGDILFKTAPGSTTGDTINSLVNLLTLKEDLTIEYRDNKLFDYQSGNNRLLFGQGYSQINIIPSGAGARINLGSPIHLQTINSTGGLDATQITLGTNAISYKSQANAPSGVNHAFTTNTLVTALDAEIIRISNFTNKLFSFNADGGMNMNGIPTSNIGLTPGQVWRDGNDLKIV